MKDTDKVTLTIGQLKKLIKESKTKKLIKEFKETEDGFEIITYNDILDYLDGFSVDDLKEIYTDAELDVDRFLDNFFFPENGENVENALKVMASLLLKGKTIDQLRKLYGEQEI